MKKIIRLTESDLTRIVKQVIKENEDNTQSMDGRFSDENELQDLIKQARDFLENECGYDLHDLNLMSEDDIVEALFDEGNIELAQEIDSLLDFESDFNQKEYDDLLDQAREFLHYEIGLEEDEVYDMSDDQIIDEIKHYDKGLYHRLEDMKYLKPIDLDEPYDSIGGHSVNDLRRTFKNIRK